MKDNKTNIIIILSILLAVAVVAACALGCLYVRANNKIEEISKQTSSNSKSTSDTEVDTTTKNNYDLFKENFASTLKSLDKEGYAVVQRTVYVQEEDEGYKHGIKGAFVDEKNDAYLLFREGTELYSRFGESYKIDTDVANVYIAYSGNGGFSDIIFIKNDGTADRYSTASNGDTLSCENLPAVKNAVTVIPYISQDKNYGVGEYSYTIVDIDGNNH